MGSFRADLKPSHARLAVGGGVLLAIVLGLHQIGDRNLWFDEAFSVAVARLDGSRLVHTITRGDPSQSFYYVLLHFWIPLGDSETLLRLLSVIFAAATVPMLYLVGRDLFGTRIGATAAVLLPLNSYFIEQAQEARGYSLVMLLVTTATFLYIRAVRNGRKMTWGLYALVSTLAVATHAFALFVLGVHALASLVFNADKKQRRSTTIAVSSILGLGAIVAIPISKIVLGVIDMPTSISRPAKESVCLATSSVNRDGCSWAIYGSPA